MKAEQPRPMRELVEPLPPLSLEEMERSIEELRAEERRAYDARADAGPEEEPNPVSEENLLWGLDRVDWTRLPMDLRWRVFEEMQRLKDTGIMSPRLRSILEMLE